MIFRVVFFNIFLELFIFFVTYLHAFQKQKGSGGNTVAKSPGTVGQPQSQTPTASVSYSPTSAQSVDPLSRTQSMPAPDTSQWTRVDDCKCYIVFHVMPIIHHNGRDSVTLTVSVFVCL